MTKELRVAILGGGRMAQQHATAIRLQPQARFVAVGDPYLSAEEIKERFGKDVEGYKSAEELSMPNAAGQTGWDVIVGSPATYVYPLDPLMVESIAPRAGTNPATGAALVTASNPLGNPINGHEYTIAQNDDLQYACVFDLPTPRDCSDPSVLSCDCNDPGNDNPLCATNPGTGDKTLQVKAKAYPGIRHLEVVKGVKGVAASVCPAQLTDPTSVDFAYRPAMRSLLDRVSTRLKKP